ncbi:hypothetical protein F3157_07590 [Virgibacillus dakarensis]|uniref:PucR C-terminal helix-turn-helix domain-containing protein n=1 Tax=Lentibacillus populi TaxID=1827502 RepID=A0A9W5U012_9BACI|nr:MULTISPECIES: helix-turn-helix domain-containing protein [Bacillaceae]MBT2218231.1 helix-turn-helix domain-containing protein [Virgibacillus dakarensis]MTW85525.1 hypothetical protein [Virgibacillus dakarensis]GGB51433.1 hypothetical protein GCM10011409_31250 [Lentibacillus populi]
MIKKLQAIFPSLTALADANHVDKNTYKWFITAENEVIGIKKHELTEKNTLLLSAFLTPYKTWLPQKTLKEQQWTQIIENNEPPDDSKNINAYRFIYFCFPLNKLEPSAFKEAIHAIFTREVPILWENEHSGIIIEEKPETISYEQIVEVLMSDLYVKINFYVGSYCSDLRMARQYYQTVLTDGKIVLEQTGKAVVSCIDAIPYLFIDRTDHDFLVNIPEIVLKEVIDDDQLLQTIETFIHCNLNISITAKKLYLHRNSLQYRVDKFIEKTGIDIRQFHQAMTVQLALLAKKYMD